MSPRERILAAIIGCMVVLMAGYYGVSQVFSHFDRMNKQIANAESDVRRKEREQRLGLIDVAKLEAFRDRALTDDREQAEAIYKEWLYKVVNDAELTDPIVKIDAGRRFAPNNYIHSFTISGSGKLPQLTGLLYEFYSTDLLHRVKSLVIKPREGKTLDLSVGVEVLAIPGSPERERLTAQMSQRMQGKSRAEIEGPILERNMFGPPNNPPEFAQLGSTYAANVGVDFNLNVRVNDADPTDLTIVQGFIDKLPGASFRNNQLSWRPAKEGEYLVSFEARDDGVPARSIQKDVIINVGPAPPPPAPPAVVEKAPPFNHARFAVVSAILNTRNGPQVWVNIRTQQKKLVLFEGDEFQVGELSGEVRVIDTDKLCMEFLTGGKVMVVNLEQALAEASEQAAGQ